MISNLLIKNQKKFNMNYKKLNLNIIVNQKKQNKNYQKKIKDSLYN